MSQTRTGSEIRQSEAQSKMIQDRITSIERHLGTLCDTLSSYTRKTARLRDKGDLLAKEIVNYAEYEKLNPSLKKGLTTFAEHLSAVQDHRQAEVERLDAKSVLPLSNYGLLCKQTKNELKSAFSAHDKEQNQRKKLEKIQNKNPSDREQIQQARNDLQKATVDATRSERALEQQMETFESKKLADVKKILSDFVKIEMIFHAKALEVYTQCFQSLSDIDPECDLEEFLRQIHPNVGSSKRMSIASTVSNLSGETPRSTPSSHRKEQNNTPTKQTTPKQKHTPKQPQSTPKQQTTPKQHHTPIQVTPKQQSTPPKQSAISVRPQNSTPPTLKGSSNKANSSPAKRIIPVGTLKDDSEEEDDDDDDDDDISEYEDDEDESDWDDTTEASTARTPNGIVKK